MRNPQGWFSLVGLYWLKEGENRIGSDPGSTVILPEGRAPAVAGTLVRRGGAVRLEAAPGVPLQIDGRPVTAADLVSDEKGKPTEVRLGSLGFFLIQRGERLGVRVRDSASPALASFQGLDNYPVDPAWRVSARFEPYQPPRPVAVPNILGDVEEQASPGAVVFERDGATHRLDALEGGEDGSLFLIFADATNQTETYGAGRFLDTAPPKDGQVVVDFNQSYNPPCAFTAFATCPLPPQQNRLALDVRAGEKKYGTGHP
ncbi:MAG TPA: DUF1684 domain-containing protein [Thermoanaerobaculia bacterium]|nr:DUF1684 domain-containing protein [Thermoanaerobaculia bacterium]